jgi:alginate O-acetyltransferase complex protein AlgI
VFVIYWFVANRNLKLQNLFVIVANYVLYAWRDWRFLSLIAFSTLVDCSVGRRLAREEAPRARKLLLWTSILVNLGFLGFFKYYNLFLDSFVAGFSVLGPQFKRESLTIVLPVRISFYTFQTLSYTIDVYRRKLDPTADVIGLLCVCEFLSPIGRRTYRASNAPAPTVLQEANV